MEDHELAARQLGVPELALSREDAESLSRAIGQFCELTNFRPSGTTWTWLSVGYTFVSIYGIKAVRALDRRRRESAAIPPAPKAAAHPAAPVKEPVRTAAVVPPPPSPLDPNQGAVVGVRPPARPAAQAAPLAGSRPTPATNVINRFDLGPLQPAPGLPIVEEHDINGAL